MTLSAAELVPGLPLLRHLMTIGLEPSDPKHTAALVDLEMLPYSLTAAQDALYRYLRAHRDVITTTLAKMDPNVGAMVRGSEARDSLGYTVDGFLDAGRRTQNAVIPLLSRAFHTSLPSSLADLVRDLAKGKRRIRDDIDQAILEYWHPRGQRLKDYRDLAQHTTLAASDARVFRGPDGPLLQLLLPSNPEVKSTQRLSFEPPVHAFEFMEEAFRWLVGLTRHIAHRAAATVAHPQQLAVTLLRTPITLGGAQPGVRIIAEDEIDAKLRRVILRFDGAFGIRPA